MEVGRWVGEWGGGGDGGVGKSRFRLDPVELAIVSWLSGQGDPPSCNRTRRIGEVPVSFYGAWFGDDKYPSDFSVSSALRRPIGIKKVRLLTEGTNTAIEMASSTDLLKDWDKRCHAVIKAHITKVMKARTSMLSCPYKGYLEQLDKMLAALDTSVRFVKFTTAYFKKFSNLDKYVEVGCAFQDWVKDNDLQVSHQMHVLLGNAVLFSKLKEMRPDDIDFEGIMGSTLLTMSEMASSGKGIEQDNL